MRTIAPSSGIEGQRTAPRRGLIKAAFSRFPTPSHGHHIDFTICCYSNGVDQPTKTTSNTAIDAIKCSKKEKMKNTNRDLLLDLAAKFPDIKKLPHFPTILERMPDDAAIAIMDAEFEASMAAIDELLTNSSLEDIGETVSDIPPQSSTPIVTPSPYITGTQHISIRLRGMIVAAFKARALATGTKYQTLINRTLQSAVASWVIPGSHL